MKTLFRAALYPIGLIIGITAALFIDQRIMLTLSAASVVVIIVKSVMTKEVSVKKVDS